MKRTRSVRWVALFEKMEDVNEGCGVSEGVWHVVTDGVFEDDAPTLDEALRDALLKYQTCVTPMTDELRALRDLKPDLRALLEYKFTRENRAAMESFTRDSSICAPPAVLPKPSTP